MATTMLDQASRRQQLFAALTGCFKASGYEGASLSELSTATGLAKASLYHRFPGGKEDIGRQVLADSARRFTGLVLRPLQGEAPAAERLAAMFEGVLAFYADPTPACLMNTMMMGSGQHLFGSGIAATVRAWRQAMARALTEQGLTAGEAEARAIDLIAAIEGALVVARILQDPAGFRAAIDRLRRVAAGGGS